jgi:hypothetical protein
LLDLLNPARVQSSPLGDHFVVHDGSEQDGAIDGVQDVDTTQLCQHNEYGCIHNDTRRQTQSPSLFENSTPEFFKVNVSHKCIHKRLHEIADTLPPQQVHALLTLLESVQPVSDEEFARRLAEATEEEADEETVARILAAEAEPVTAT